jgi:hypothetical protein
MKNHELKTWLREQGFNVVGNVISSDDNPPSPEDVEYLVHETTRLSIANLLRMKKSDSDRVLLLAWVGKNAPEAKTAEEITTALLRRRL